MNKISFALIGCGRIGKRHAAHIASYGTLAAVCDTDITRANELAVAYNATAYQDINDLLAQEKNILVVSVCTPNGLHAAHSIAALKAGKHVLCEKPMAISVTDCGEMIMAAEANNRRLFIIKQNRFNPPVVAVKALLDQQKLGKLYSVQVNCFWNRNEDYYVDSWKGTKTLDGGTLYTQFSHFVDLMYWFAGDVKKVYALTANFAHQQTIEFEDTGVVALQFNSGALGTIHYTVNAFARNMEGSITLFGEKGTVKIGGQYLNELEYQLIDGYEIQNLPEGNKPNEYGNYTGSMSNHRQVYENLVNVINNNASIAANLFEGLKTVEIIEKIYAAAG